MTTRRLPGVNEKKEPMKKIISFACLAGLMAQATFVPSRP